MTKVLDDPPQSGYRRFAPTARTGAYASAMITSGGLSRTPTSRLIAQPRQLWIGAITDFLTSTFIAAVGFDRRPFLRDGIKRCLEGATRRRSAIPANHNLLSFGRGLDRGNPTSDFLAGGLVGNL